MTEPVLNPHENAIHDPKALEVESTTIYVCGWRGCSETLTGGTRGPRGRWLWLAGHINPRPDVGKISALIKDVGLTVDLVLCPAHLDEFYRSLKGFEE